MKALIQLDSKTRIAIDSTPFWVKFWKSRYYGSKVLAWVERKTTIKMNGQIYTKYLVTIAGKAQSIEIIASNERAALSKAYEKHKTQQPDINKYEVKGPTISLN